MKQMKYNLESLPLIEAVGVLISLVLCGSVMKKVLEVEGERAP